MSSNLSHVIDKIKKLRSLANGFANANEAANAAAAANKLIDEFRLSESDLSVEVGYSDPLMVDLEYVYQSGKITAWKARLCMILSSHYGCAIFNDANYSQGRKVSRYQLIGRRSDIDIVRYMFAWLTLECQRLCDLHAKGRGRVFVASYAQGFVEGIKSQLFASREEVKKATTSTAMVALNNRLNESNDFMRRQHPGLRYESSSSQGMINSDAFQAGKQKGQNVHLGGR